MELGFKLKCDEKGEYNLETYTEMFNFCQDKGYAILDKRPEYFEIVEAPKPTAEQLADRVRSVRSQYMGDTLNKVERFETQKAVGIETTDSAETYKNYLLYLQYLRDIPQNKDFPNIEVLTFDEWSDK